eukprot:1369359-Amphidinium_carterae.2
MSSSSSSRSSATSTSSSDSTYVGETTRSTLSTATSTSTTVTWGIVQGQALLAADGVSASSVRGAFVSAVAEATDVPADWVQCLLEHPLSGARRLFHRRLTAAAAVWQATFTIEVPSALMAGVEELLGMIEDNTENKTTEFSESLLNALMLKASNATMVSQSFAFGGLYFVIPQGALDGFQQSVTAKEAEALGALLESNESEIVLELDGGVVAVASRASKDDIIEAGSLTIGKSAESEITVVVPAATFESIEGQGIEFNDVVLLVLDLGTTLGQFITQNDTFEGREVVVRGSININLYDGDGIKIPVNNLSQPVVFSFNAEEADCAVWDEELQEWSSGGLTLVRATDANITCATTHLSLFAGIAKGFLDALECSQANLLTKEGLDALWDDDWLLQPWTLTLFALLAVMVFIMAAALALDMKRQCRGMWINEHFLIVDNLDEFPPDDEEVPVVTSDRTCAVCLVGCLAVWADVLGSSFRDVVDELCGKFFVHFGTLRSLCEAIRDVLSGDDDASNCMQIMQLKMSGVLVYIAKTTLHRSVHLNACAKLGIHPEDDLDGAIEELGINGSPAQEAGGSPSNAASSPQGSPQAAASSPKLQQQCSGVSVLHHHAHHNERNARLFQMHREKSSHVSLEKGKSHLLCHQVPRAMQQWFMHGPIGSVFSFSISTTSSLRALYLLCDIMGSLALATLFTSSSGGARSKRNKAACNTATDVLEIAGRLILIGVAAGILTALPVGVINSCHVREFVHVPYHGGKAWKKQLRVWRVRDFLSWFLGVAYATFCILYVTLFFANVANSDQKSWLISSGVSAIEDLLVLPLAAFLVPALLAPLSIRILMRIHRTKSKEEVIQMLHRHEGDDVVLTEESAGASPATEREDQSGNMEQPLSYPGVGGSDVGEVLWVVDVDKDEHLDAAIPDELDATNTVEEGDSESDEEEVLGVVVDDGLDAAIPDELDAAIPGEQGIVFNSLVDFV